MKVNDIRLKQECTNRAHALTGHPAAFQQAQQTVGWEETSMAAEAIASSQERPTETRVVRPGVKPANENRRNLESARDSAFEHWPIAVLGFGLLLSALWSLGLLFLAYQLLQWAFAS